MVRLLWNTKYKDCFIYYLSSKNTCIKKNLLSDLTLCLFSNDMANDRLKGMEENTVLLEKWSLIYICHSPVRRNVLSWSSQSISTIKKCALLKFRVCSDFLSEVSTADVFHISQPLVDKSHLELKNCTLLYFFFIKVDIS